MSNCDHNSRKAEWEPRHDTDYRDNPDGSGRRQSRVRIEVYCPCGAFMKAEIQRDWTNV